MNKTLRTQRGIALIEVALIMVFTMLVVLGVSFLSRAIWHAAVMHKAVHQTARLVAAMPEEVFRNDMAKTGMPAVARRIFLEVATEAGLEAVPVADTIAVLCDGAICTTVVPQRVQVSAPLMFTDDLFGGALTRVTGLQPKIFINAIAEVPYVRE